MPLKANTLVPHVCGESAGCAHSGAGSRWRSRWSWIRCNITRTAFYGTRGQPPGPGVRHVKYCTATFPKRLSPRGAGQHFFLRLLAGRSEYSGHEKVLPVFTYPLPVRNFNVGNFVTGFQFSEITFWNTSYWFLFSWN